MFIVQISDTHIKRQSELAYGRVDTAGMLSRCVQDLVSLKPTPDLILITGDLVDQGWAEEYAYLKSILAPLTQRIIAVPGNHDQREAMRAAFRSAGYLPPAGQFLHYAIDGDYPLRIVGLDTLLPGQAGGELCSERIHWLHKTLGQKPAAPTLLLMHHPPFVTGIGHMDRIGLKGSGHFAAVMARHPQVELVMCGHLHRVIHATVGGRPILACPSPAHQVALDIDENAKSCFRMEPPGYMLHWWNGCQLISHHAFIGHYDGPYPFFNADGQLVE
jgi:3',5'-cyclic AMP phosphodiesterase CpdA